MQVRELRDDWNGRQSESHRQNGCTTKIAPPSFLSVCGQEARQDLACVGFLVSRDLLWCALGHDAAAAVAALRAEIDDPVGLLDDVKVVLDHQDSVAEFRQAAQNVKEFAHVQPRFPDAWRTTR